MVVLRRGYSVPERLTLFAAGAAMVGAVYPALMTYTGGHALPCPLRTLTGVPCPFCGLTTATVALTHGEWMGAASANPLVFPVAALLFATAPLLGWRAAGHARAPQPWSATARRRATWAMASLAGLSWLFQLHRFGIL